MTLNELRKLHDRVLERLRGLDDASELISDLEDVDLDEFYDEDHSCREHVDIDEFYDEDHSCREHVDIEDEVIPVSTFHALVRSGARMHNEANTMTLQGLCEFVEDELGR